MAYKNALGCSACGDVSATARAAMNATLFGGSNAEVELEGGSAGTSLTGAQSGSLYSKSGLSVPTDDILGRLAAGQGSGGAFVPKPGGSSSSGMGTGTIVLIGAGVLAAFLLLK